MKRKKVVIITPLLNEEENIHPFIDEVKHVLSTYKQHELSFMFVDDGSTDNSWRILEELAKNNKKISALKLSRNFGSHTAWYAGLKNLSEKHDFDVAVLMTIDLQEPPTLIQQMLKNLKSGVRVVWAVRENRADDWLATIFSQGYYSLVKRFALPTMPVGGMDFCAIDKTVVTAVVDSAEKNTSLLALILWLGYPQVMLTYRRGVRLHGRSRWTLGKKLKLFIDTFVAFSYAPIRVTSYLGFLISGLGFVYAAIVFIRRIVYGAPIEGWSSLMLVILVLSGVQMITLGIVAEYLWRTLDETRKRPMYLIDKKINL